MVSRNSKKKALKNEELKIIIPTKQPTFYTEEPTPTRTPSSPPRNNCHHPLDDLDGDDYGDGNNVGFDEVDFSPSRHARADDKRLKVS